MARQAIGYDVDMERIAEALRLRKTGMSYRAIAEQLGTTRQSVERWVKNPKLDPYLDEVALERARKGDSGVFHNLTPFEMREFLDRLKAEVDAMDLHDRMQVLEHLNREFGVSVTDLVARRDRRKK